MQQISAVNNFVIKFANVNGTGSASANGMFAKAVFRMGLHIGPRNIFPSNIQGLPTWYEVRISDKGYTGRKGDVDFIVAMNPQSLKQDIVEVNPGGYLLYDSTKTLASDFLRDDLNFIGIPIMEMCNREYDTARLRQLFKNIIYVGALAALLDIEFELLTSMMEEQFSRKPKLIRPNVHALEMGYQYAKDHFQCPLPIRVERADNVGDSILVDGNTAAGLGCVYGGATVVAWYPITPSTSLVDAFTTYAKRLRVDPGSGKNNHAVLQVEDELAAIGVTVGANWNGARAFTATSGPGISLMSEFLGLAYFAEIPAVLFNVQRGGPSTGMPTRTQQSDLLSCAYASHGDTKQVLLFPANPSESFEMAADSFDLADRLQTPIIVMLDLDIGMNDWVSKPLDWDDARRYDRGKVLNAEQLDKIEKFGRYLDVDGDGICYRTLPGTHPEKGAFFTRGTSRDTYAVYTEDGKKYVENVDRLTRKFETATQYLPKAEIEQKKKANKAGVVYYGSTDAAMGEAIDTLTERGYSVDTLRIRAFPFESQIKQFIDDHDVIYLVEQNRDAQMKKMIVNELEVNPAKVKSVLYYEGMPISATFIATEIEQLMGAGKTSRSKVKS